jgi:hypothetical protein
MDTLGCGLLRAALSRMHQTPGPYRRRHRRAVRRSRARHQLSP